MMIVTSIGEAPAIQYNGLTDKSMPSKSLSMIGKPLIVGHFRRGLVNRVVVVNKNSIRASLGYEPNNPDYVAVQDKLNAGTSEVHVLNLGAKPKPAKRYHIKINGQVVEEVTEEQLKAKGYRDDEVSIIWDALKNVFVVTVL